MVERLEIELARRPLGADDGVGAFVRPDRSAFPWDIGQLEQHRLERRFLLAQAAFQLARLSARLFRTARQVRPAPRAPLT